MLFEISHHRTAGKKIPVTPMKETGTRGGEAFERARALCCYRLSTVLNKKEVGGISLLVSVRQNYPFPPIFRSLFMMNSTTSASGKKTSFRNNVNSSVG